jgi:hypothetical protein
MYTRAVLEPRSRRVADRRVGRSVTGLSAHAVTVRHVPADDE